VLLGQGLEAASGSPTLRGHFAQKEHANRLQRLHPRMPMAGRKSSGPSQRGLEARGEVDAVAFSPDGKLPEAALG
jgi:hypothetical protein